MAERGCSDFNRKKAKNRSSQSSEVRTIERVPIDRILCQAVLVSTQRIPACITGRLDRSSGHTE